MFDWRAIKRWGLKERNLPQGSIVLNRQPTVWESYKAYIIGGISLILLETLLIIGLLWQQARRRKAETELAIAFEAAQESERALPPGRQHCPSNDLDVRSRQAVQLLQSALAGVHRSAA